MHIRGFHRQGGQGLFVPSYYRSASLGATIAQLFRALPSGTPGLGYRYADSRFNSAARNGSSGFGASSGPLGLVLDQARGALDALGPNQIVDGEFNDGTDWTKGTGWSISGGSAQKAPGVASILSQAQNIIVGQSYLLEYTVTVTDGIISPRFTGGTSVVGASIDNSGAYQQILTATAGNNRLAFSASALFDGTLDNVSLRPVPGTHAHALTDAARPTLGGFAGGSRLSAQFNGTNSAMQTVAPLDMSSTDEVTVIAVVRSLAAFGWIVESSASVDANAGTFAVRRDSSLQYRAFSRGNVATINVPTVSFSAPDNAIVAMHAKIATPALRIRRNSGAEITNAASQGTGNYGNYLLNIGGRNGAPSFTGDIAALCIVGRQPSSLPSGWLGTMTDLLVPPDATFS